MDEVEAEEVVAAGSSSSVSGSSVETPVSKHPQARMTGPARRSTKGGWTEEEDNNLIRAVKFYGGRNWKKIAESFPGRTDVQCLHRWQKVLNPELIKGPWTKEDDDRIIELVAKHGSKKWSLIAKSLPGRIGKQCRERWHNHLNPVIKKDAWTEAEEVALIRAHQIYGNKWAEIARFLPGRADNSIKNHWNCSVKKKLCSYIASGLLSPFPCVAHNYHNALKGKGVAACKHNGDSSFSCDQSCCLNGDAACLDSSIPSATGGEKQHLSQSRLQIRASEASEGIKNLENLEKDMDNPNAIMSSQSCTIQEDGDLSDESGGYLSSKPPDGSYGSLTLKSNETILVVDADLRHTPGKLEHKPGDEADPSCFQLRNFTLSLSSSSPMVETELLSENSNCCVGNKEIVDIASSVPTKDSDIVQESQRFVEKSTGESCDTYSDAASTSIIHVAESCDIIQPGECNKVSYIPEQFEDSQFGRLCYNPVNLTNWDVTLPNFKTLESCNEWEQNPVYSVPHISTENTYFRGSSSESILRTAARNLKNIPSILRKRGRETSRLLSTEISKTKSARFDFNGLPAVRCGNYSMRPECWDNLNVKQLSISHHDPLHAQRDFAVKSVERRLQNEPDMEWENVNAKSACTGTACNPPGVNLL
ncbi:transcription factor MYB3R-4-like [Aristolochia californica]|uniref:transcription factor MYB3R-4-like n=1 Tax=Aristolochia californica TaxID=171875 RepID=UPI0035D9E94E